MHDLAAMPSHSDRKLFRSDVIEGLSRLQKTIPCRWLYDERGSDLFEEITRLEDYYPTRAETAILRTRKPELRKFAGAGAILIEYGAGAGVKTEFVLDALAEPQGYVPVDIAQEHLLQTAHRMECRFRSLWVRPVERDFLSPFEMPAGIPTGRRVGFFPGSTIGNLDAAEAEAFLSQMLRHVGPDGTAIVGVDLVKRVEALLRAYDDCEGATARFNLNLLARINRELAGDFHLDRFRHVASWNEAKKAIEMHLLSLTDQWAAIGQRRFHFRKGETIHTESSRKCDRRIGRARGACGLARVAGLGGRQAVFLCVRASALGRAESELICHLARSPQNQKSGEARCRARSTSIRCVPLPLERSRAETMHQLPEAAASVPCASVLASACSKEATESCRDRGVCRAPGSAIAGRSRESIGFAV
jgi:dimethylhistidine N-methyltransferase